MRDVTPARHAPETTRPSTLVDALPRFGAPGSRSAALHRAGISDEGVRASVVELNRFALLRWLGAVGTLLIGLGGLGGGALPVVDNPWFDLPGGAFMGRMLQASSSLVFIGVGCLVVAWLLMGPFVGAGSNHARISARVVFRTFLVWAAPLLLTAPLFTQDIYSYLAQGSIVRQGLDPYAAGPVELLGTEDRLARSVPFIWAHSPSPYGPVALGIASAVSWITQDSIYFGVLCHRVLSLAGVVAAAWGIRALARRCGVHGATALWLGVLNPLAILHLIAGIHNESIMLGFLLVGMEVGLRGIDALAAGGQRRRGWALFLISGALLSCGGLVKVTGFIALGFTGMALARVWARGGGKRASISAICTAALVQAGCLAVTAGLISWFTGIGLGWVTGQGGAATIRSWLSLTTDIGVISGFTGMLLQLGDHTEAILSITRGVGLLVAGAFLVRMLWATFRGSIHPVGGLGVATLVLVLLFPVVHPWYPLWGILPLAAWANRFFFRAAVAIYSVLFSFLVLPRGLALPPGTVATIYLAAAVWFAVMCAAAWFWYRRTAGRGLH
ncbi:polyprenol phosphomannose-dependent alpha 1,6 mannosyltransferase MptB [Corynebacterium hadale]